MCVAASRAAGKCSDPATRSASSDTELHTNQNATAANPATAPMIRIHSNVTSPRSPLARRRRALPVISSPRSPLARRGDCPAISRCP